MNANITSSHAPAEGPILILNWDDLTPHQRRYWGSFAGRGAAIDIVDPDRRPLRSLRKRWGGCRLYRASTGGRWGKSAATVRL
jgi:hypothetical protein